jgi:hypothetical protein
MKKRKTVVPKAERIAPRETTKEDLMDYLEFIIEFEKGG